MNEWLITASYKLDLACFCNLLTKEDAVVSRHQKAYDHFFDMIHARPDLISFATDLLQQKGLMIGTATATLLSLSDYHGTDIRQICSLFDDEDNQSPVRDYLIENGFSAELAIIMKTMLPQFSDMLRYFHEHGFHDYWHELCSPILEKKIESFIQKSIRYPIISRVNELLGFERIQTPQITLFLGCFNAPYGIGLKNAFISDQRWCFENTVAIAVHELIHPPFDRAVIKQMAAEIWKDDFFREAKSLLPNASGYAKPEDFLEENLVEGTHLFLSELLGVETDPLNYLLTHDYGSHVVSVILYDALKKGYRDQAKTIQETVERLIEEGSLKPGQIKSKYLAIYQQAGLADQIPFSV